MASKRDDEKLIKTNLIPSLVDSGKITFGPNGKPAVLRSVEAKRLSMEESFMLTACYKVTVEIAESSDENAATSLTKLIVKVNLMFFCYYRNDFLIKCVCLQKKDIARRRS